MGLHQQTLADSERLLNAGKPRAGLELLYKLGGDDQMRYDAHYWFQRSLAEQLLHNSKESETCIEEARRCPNWQSYMHGDYYRDVALAQIRRGNRAFRRHAKKKEDERQRLIAYAISQMELSFSSDDLNRQASILMTRGRWEFDRSNFGRAVELHAKADELWHEADQQADRGWVRNNRYHWFKAVRRSTTLTKMLWGYSRNDVIRLLHHVLDDDPNRKRRVSARVIFFTGEVGTGLEKYFL